eukprot:CAMPEP_0172510256 /NCGR_PEP_ID=MMETSP1066-20121228/227338_1 /TAXON_ID=671091 /ORGANISM="Coscinodiscus wailesii, Strain CCMP2513" /LENGTH=352 /DNA_ID=CAMNT_0013289131 /DNA_START=31 /DNA_END=1086 /DNA_ORIENTATION=-
MTNNDDKNKTFKVAIVGATGAVGLEIIRTIHSRSFPCAAPSLYASARSAGKTVATPYGALTINEFERGDVACAKYDVIFLAVSGSFALRYARDLASSTMTAEEGGGGGPLVIDNSSAFRLVDDVPLVVPEINLDSVAATTRLIANPNCTTAIAAMALWPIHCAHGGIKRCIVSTYQAASGAGAEGMEELKRGCASQLETNELPEAKVFSHPLPFNVIPHIDKFQENGYTKEEMKVAWETRKIFNDPQMLISCTAVRIPTLRAHSESITVETRAPITPASARESLTNQPGVAVVDEPLDNVYPMPLTATSRHDVEVGRLRQSLVFEEYGLDLFVCGDQLLRGAALNAVLIAEG